MTLQDIRSPFYHENYPDNAIYALTLKTENLKATIPLNNTGLSVVQFWFTTPCDDYLQEGIRNLKGHRHYLILKNFPKIFKFDFFLIFISFSALVQAISNPLNCQQKNKVIHQFL